MKIDVISVLIIQGLTMILGISLKLEVGPKRVSQGTPCFLQCVLTDASNLFDEIIFYRHQHPIAGLIQRYGKCRKRLHKPTKGYSAVCKAGTDNNWSNTKLYILVIDETSYLDERQWYCALRKAGLWSNPVQPIAEGYKLVMTVIPESVIRSTATFLVCNISNSLHLVGEIEFYRNDSIMASVTQKLGQCVDHSVVLPASYEIKCREGTNVRRSSTKVYLLLVKSALATRDSADWYCDLARSRNRSNVVRVDVNMFVLKITTNRPYGVVGQSLLITCTVNNAADYSDEIVFYRDENFWGSLFQHKGYCMVYFNAHSDDYSLTCSKAANTRYTLTKQYTLKIIRVARDDVAVWYCTLQGFGIDSNQLWLEVHGPDGKILKLPDSENALNPYVIVLAAIAVVGVIGIVIVVLTGYLRHTSADSTIQTIDKKTEENAESGYINPSFEGGQS